MPTGLNCGIAGFRVAAGREGELVSAADERSLDWRKGRTCTNGECVEVAWCESGVWVRNSEVPSAALYFTAASWQRFTASIAARPYTGSASGEADRD